MKAKTGDIGFVFLPLDISAAAGFDRGMCSLPRLLFFVGCLTILPNTIAAERPNPLTVDLWPGTPPGEKGGMEPEKDTTKTGDNLVSGKPVVRLGNVSKPTLTIYSPPKDKNTGTAVIVCPGGGYQILALDLEGTEICGWLNNIGVTGILLKYRVPKRVGLEKHTAALQDAQRALGLARQHAADWGFHGNRVGILGFSAGGHLAAIASNNHSNRTYSRIDDADDKSCRPDFAVLIYPAYLTVAAENDRIVSDLTITSNTPPVFIAMAQDDPVRVENSLFYCAALRKARVPFELHIYPSGGHGYGLRPAKSLVVTWPKRAEEWMRNTSLLSAP